MCDVSVETKQSALSYSWNNSLTFVCSGLTVIPIKGDLTKREAEIMKSANKMQFVFVFEITELRAAPKW